MGFLWSHFIIQLTQILSPKNVILPFKLTKIFVTFVVCFDSPVVVASSAAPEEKLVNNKCRQKSCDRTQSEKRKEQFYNPTN